MIDFPGIASAALGTAPSLLAEWFPAGQVIDGEFRIGDISGSPGKSLAVNLSTGLWRDRAGGPAGGDLISLYAAARGATQSEAAAVIAQRLGLPVTTDGATPPRPNPAPAKSPTAAGQWTSLPEAAGVPPPTEHPTRGAPSARWEYRTVAGALIGVICRFETPDGKVFAPLSWCAHPTHPPAWRWQAFVKPRPLYNLQTLARFPDAPVLIVEGEKSADAAAKLLPGYVAMTWPGGASAPQTADWSPLLNREVLIWPDADEPSSRAAAAIASRLPDAIVIRPPSDWTNGYDLADALRDGWTTARVQTHIACERRRLHDEYEAARRSEPPVIEEPIESPPPPVSNVFADAPFRILGYDHGTYFYLPDGSQQITHLPLALHNRQNLLGLAPRDYWDATFSTEKLGTDWTAAANALIQSSHAAGLFSRDAIRGRGCWIDNTGGTDHVVWHGGDRILTDGQTYAVNKFPSKYIYERAPAFQIESVPPASNAEAARLIELSELLPWESPLHAKLLAGWCALAPICGALEWRPHIWITGRSGIGKSFIVRHIVEAITGKFALKLQGSTSEAGIRQPLGTDGRPVIIDEAESEDEHTQSRFKSVLQLARQASTEGGGIISKGTSDGTGILYNVRSCFCFASIGVAAVNWADTSRITILPLTARKASPAQFESVKSCWLAIMDNPDFGAMIRARSIHNAITIRDNSRIFSTAVAAQVADQRTGDQIGALLAGAYSLTSTKPIALSVATQWVAAQDWSNFTTEEPDRDENQALARLLDHVISITPTERSSVGDLIRVATAIGSGQSDRDTATDTLALIGIRLITGGIAARNGFPDGAVVISNSHAEIAKIFARTPWAGKWKDQLHRLPDARPLTAFRFGAAIHRAVALPVSFFNFMPDIPLPHTPSDQAVF